MNPTVPGESSDQSLLDTWVSKTSTPVVWVVVTATTSADSILSAETPPSFSEWDQANRKMKSWVQFAQVGSKCMYMGHPFEVIKSGNKKLLMLSEIIKQDMDDMKGISLHWWIGTIADRMTIPGLRVMSTAEMKPISHNRDIFPHWSIYLTSSYILSNYVKAWDPTHGWWTPCNTDYAYHDSNYKNPLVLRCVVKLS